MLSNKIKTRIDGVSSAQIINFLIQNGVCIENVKIKINYAVFDLNEKDIIKLDEVCKRFHKKYSIVSKNRLKIYSKKILRQIGSLTAILIISIFMFVYNMSIYEVNINVANGNTLDTKQITEILERNNIVVGGERTKFSVQDLEREIVSSVKNISGCVIRRNGGIVDIMLYPATLKGDERKKTIVSNYDAVITKVEVFAGEQKVSVGDVVKKGDILIESENEANGSVFGKTYYTDYIIYNEKQLKPEFTGNVVYDTSIKLFGLNLFNNQNLHKFSSFITQDCVFYLNKNLFLPINITKTAIMEINYVETIVPFEEREAELKKN